MRAYYYDNLPGDQRLLHDSPPSAPVSAERLKELVGIQMSQYKPGKIRSAFHLAIAVSPLILLMGENVQRPISHSALVKVSDFV